MIIICFFPVEEVDQTYCGPVKYLRWFKFSCCVLCYYREIWEKKPLLIRRHDSSHNKGWFSTEELDRVLREVSRLIVIASAGGWFSRIMHLSRKTRESDTKLAQFNLMHLWGNVCSLVHNKWNINETDLAIFALTTNFKSKLNLQNHPVCSSGELTPLLASFAWVFSSVF